MHFDPRCFGVLFLWRPLSYGSPVVVFLVHGHPCFRNFYYIIPVDVVRVKSYVDRLFGPACVPMRITIINFTSFQSGLCPVLYGQVGCLAHVL